MSDFHGGPAPQQQPGPFQYQPPKKKHTVRNVILISTAAFVVFFGCTAILASSVDSATEPTDEPTVVTTVDTGPSPEPVVTPTNEPTQPPAAKTTQPKPTKTAPAMTASQEQAIGAAEDYLEFSAFSRKGLIKQLSSEYGSGFSKADATFAVDHIKVNWNEQAAKAANDYLETSHFSRAGLIQQLESEYGSQFTHAQAVYGVNKAGL